jgi:hypothetical protein
MTSKIACTLAVIGTLTASAQAQELVPQPTKADAEKVVKIISGDKTKIETYCKLAEIGDEIKKASAENKIEQLSKIEQLAKQADDLQKKLGLEFILLNAGLEDVDLQSNEHQELSAELDKLDKLCPPK